MNSQQQKKNSNLGVVIKESLHSGLSKLSTFIIFIVFSCILLTMLILIPFIVVKAIGNDHPDAISGAAKVMLPIFFYNAPIFIGIVTINITLNNFNIEEMVFVLSRPISRNKYIAGKYIASVILTFPICLLSIIGFVGSWYVFKSYGGGDAFSGGDLNWAMPITICFLCWFCMIGVTILFRLLISKERVVITICTFIPVVLYLLYQIISNPTVVGTDLKPMITCLIIPVSLYSVGAIVCWIASFIYFQKYQIKV